MPQISVATNNGYMNSVYVAVPQNLSLEGLLQGAPLLKDAVFPYAGVPQGIEGHRALVEVKDDFVDLTITYSRVPQFSDSFFDLSRGFDSAGLTTLHVSALGTEEDSVDALLQQTVAAFPGVVDLDVLAPVENRLRSVGKLLIEEYAGQRGFINAYKHLRSDLVDVSTLPNKRLRKGVLAGVVSDVFKRTGASFDTEQYDLRLINGLSASLDGHAVELPMVYLSGPGVTPGVYGVMLLSKLKEGCAVCVASECDQSKAYVGYFFSPNRVLVGGAKLMPGMHIDITKNGGSESVGSYDFHMTGAQILSANTPYEQVEREIDDVGASAEFTPEHIAEIKQLAELFYRVRE
jgi:hypothetical protein